jgi:hypothetical protein
LPEHDFVLPLPLQVQPETEEPEDVVGQLQDDDPEQNVSTLPVATLSQQPL